MERSCHALSLISEARRAERHTTQITAPHSPDNPPEWYGARHISRAWQVRTHNVFWP